MIPILDTVRAGYLAGLCLLPTRNDGSKAPDVAAWTAFQTTRPTIAQMRAFDFAARCGFGVLAGLVSNRIESWDFDCPHTFDAFIDSAATCGLDELVRRIRAGYEDATPAGGRRWLVRYPVTVTWHDCTLARRLGREGEPKVKTLVELPLFSILAPSNGQTHPTGRPYVRCSGDFSTIAEYDSDERTALIDLARSFDQLPRPEAAPRMTGTAQRSARTDRPGDAYNACTAWGAILEPAGWTHVYDRGETSYWRRPNKSIGVSASTNLGGSDLFYPFTSSSEFEPEKSYSKFAAFAVLEHRGDFARAAQALADAGYGQPVTKRATTRPAPAQPATLAAWRWLADVQRDYVAWLWRGRLALGTLALWIGDGGLGKSRASNDVAARVSTGAAWPDDGDAPIGSVIILSAEDSASYTIRPAIEAAGGDLARVAILDAVQDGSGATRTFNLGTDLAALEELLTVTAARLIIIDPLSAYFGTALDSYRDTDVRSVLEPIVKLAERRRVSILGIMHIGKGGDRSARHRALGSVGFVNAARLVFAIGPDPDDESRRLLLPVKANLCREAPTLAFRLEDADGVARVVWEPGPVAGMTADAVLSDKPKLLDVDDEDATSVLQALLEDEDWPLDAKIALDAARAHGIAERTMRRTARRLGIEIRRLGFGGRGKWLWHRSAIGDTAPDRISSPAAADLIPDSQQSIEAIGAIVKTVSPMGNVAPMEPSKGTVSPMAPMSKHQQNTHSGIGDTSMSTRAREDADLPACFDDLVEPDASDPIGAHDE